MILSLVVLHVYFFFFFKQKTAYEMRISDWSSDVCSSDLLVLRVRAVDVAVRDAGAVPPLAQPRADPFREVDRPVLAAGTAESDGEKIGRASCRERVCQYV